MYKFTKSHAELDNRGVPRLEEYNSEVILKNIDFGKAVSNNEIEYRADGVYLKFGKKWLRGFYYMKDYKGLEYGNPRFHLFNCPTMQNRHLFHGTYHWSNASTNDFYCKDRNDWVNDVVLPLCGNCKPMLDEKISNTLEFYNSNDQEKIEITDFVSSIIPDSTTNIRGYPLNWRSIASDFKNKNGLECNSCGIKEKDKNLGFYFDVDHINGYDKSLIDNNLQLLCKLCHTYKDKYHLEQALTYPNRNRNLHNFVVKYKSIILLKNKKLLQSYNEDFSSIINHK